jgi:eukaryotic-like serine/threonine-protein kinase
LVLAHESGNSQLIGRQSFHLGFQLLWSDESGSADACLQQALTVAEAIGDSWLQVQSLVYLSILCRLTGDTDRLNGYLPALTARTQAMGHSIYSGVAQAQSAWLHYCAGEWSPARRMAQAALTIWADAPYPFEWLARWILLALARQTNQLSAAVAAGRAMLLPSQQKLADRVDAALQTAVSAWEADDVDGAQDALATAVNLAYQYGYL